MQFVRIKIVCLENRYPPIFFRLCIPESYTSFVYAYFTTQNLNMSLSAGAIQLAIVSFIAVSLAIVALGLRLWSRHILEQRLVFHGYMAIVAMLFTAGAVSIFLAGTTLYSSFPISY